MDTKTPTPTFEESIQILYDTCDEVRCALMAALAFGEKGGTICNVSEPSARGTHG